ncbi:MAG: uroporphyrinogen-III synthase [Bacteroidota bacterium]|jgi:uroporphyrinogen-III synthase
MKSAAKKSSKKSTVKAKPKASKKKAVAPKKVVVKSVKTKSSAPAKIQKILITQPKPETDKNPYFDLAKKFKVQIDFKPLIHLEGISAQEFRKFKINPVQHTAIVFTSRNAIDHFYKLCEDLRVKMSQETKYFCMTESIALYLQKYILYRKRKVFYGDGSSKNFFDVILKYKDKERFLVPCADSHKSEIPDFLSKHKLDYNTAVIFRTVPVSIPSKELLSYDMIVLFTPAAVKSLFHNIPGFKQGKLKIGAFGPQTCSEVISSKLSLDVPAPTEGLPSMAAALAKYLTANK